MQYLAKLSPTRVYLGIGVVSAVAVHSRFHPTPETAQRLARVADMAVANESISSADLSIKMEIVTSHLTTVMMNTLLWPINNVVTVGKLSGEALERFNSITSYRQETGKVNRLLTYKEYIEALCYDESFHTRSGKFTSPSLAQNKTNEK